LETRRIRFGASHDRLRDVLWFDFAPPHKYVLVNFTLTRARTNSCVSAVGAPLPLLGSLAAVPSLLSLIQIFVLHLHFARRD
jgi:hypothetical protein